MLQPLDPLMTWRVDHSDFNESDNRREIEALFQRQQAIDGLLSGRVSPDYVLDLLEFQGLDPCQYTDQAIANMDQAIAQQMPVDPNEVVFYLPWNF